MLRFVSWNVDSLNAALTGTSDRARMSHGVLESIAALDADVVALQETKLPATGPTPKHRAALTRLFPGYEIAWRSSVEPARKGYSGTMLLYRTSLPTPVVHEPHIGAPDPMDFEGRILTAEFPEFYVTTVYTPNAGSGLVRLADRMAWDEAYRDHLAELDARKPVIACGDLNVAPQEIDIAHPRANRGSAGFTDEERAGFAALLDAGFTDIYRHLHPETTGVYTWFNQIARTSKVNNSGWRIDMFLVSDRLVPAVTRADMVDTGPRQDHVPCLLEIDL